MKFYFSENLSTSQLQSGPLPWEFKPAGEISQQIRKVKEDRQTWYNTESTKHYFYTGIEALNPFLRITKQENPPLTIHVFCADYDANVSEERINEAIADMKIKPTWVERSLGGNFRLIWILEVPLRVDNYDFCVYVLQQAVKWLQLDRLPELDEPAFSNPTRLLCNGCVWRETGHGPVKEKDSQSFFVECGRKFRFNAPDDALVPLDIVQKGLVAKFPDFSWPESFEVGSMGPAFWVPGATSPKSSIVKDNGMMTFSGHAAKSFYSWSDILGAEFVKDFLDASIAKATAGIYYDTKKYHRWSDAQGKYASHDKADFLLYLKVDCNLSVKPGSDGKSPVDKALRHIQEHNGIENAAPFVMRTPGILTFQGKRRLNNYSLKAIMPAPGKQYWGPKGNFAFICYLLEHLFKPLQPQLAYFLTWFKRYFMSALDCKPQAGLYVSFSGIEGCGKGLLNRHIIGAAVGGFVEATKNLVKGGTFNSHLFEYPHWVLDDDSTSESHAIRSHVSATLKKMVSNQEHEYEKKYEVSGMVEWMGRIGLTTNLDSNSMKILSSLDVLSLNKMMMFKCVDQESERVDFPDRYEIQEILARELPFFLAWLMEYAPPGFIKEDTRLGVKEPYHDPDLMDMCHQGSPVATFKEILIETLRQYWEMNPEEKTFSGTASSIYQMLFLNPTNERMLRGYRPEQVNRYLEQLNNQKLLECTISTGDKIHKSRIWTFPRPAEAAAQPPPEPPASEPGANPFEKQP
jgi:hypothetical protein